MRDLLGVLRPAAADRLVPQPTLGQLGDLIDGVRHAGLAVDLRIVGQPRPVPPGVELAVYRVIQEALTNTLKHAGRGARSTVEVTYTPTELTARVVDDGVAADAPSPGRAGQGVAGSFEVLATYPTHVPA
jgi:signal transduction histidine kinase